MHRGPPSPNAPAAAADKALAIAGFCLGKADLKETLHVLQGREISDRAPSQLSGAAFRFDMQFFAGPFRSSPSTMDRSSSLAPPNLPIPSESALNLFPVLRSDCPEHWRHPACDVRSGCPSKHLQP